jgi:hypothetical protein
MAIAGLLAGSALLLPARAEAATPDAKPDPAGAAAAAPPAGNPKVSPYTVASRQRAEAAAAAPAHVQSMKRAQGRPAAKPRPVHTERH